MPYPTLSAWSRAWKAALVKEAEAFLDGLK